MALGQRLVAEFSKDAEPDTLSQWMAHYLAEKLTALKSARGTLRRDIEKECLDTILKIWKHRGSFPHAHRPFQDFDSIFRTLDSLDLSKEGNRYFTVEIAGREPPKPQPEKVKSWLDKAVSIDRGARALISAYVDFAVANTPKGKDTWIKEVRALVADDDADLKLFIRLIDKVEDIDKKLNLVEVERKRLEGLRDALVEMASGAGEVIPLLEARIADLKKT